MARLGTIGFENNSTTSGVEFTSTSGSPTIVSTVVRSGRYAGRASSLTSGTRKAFLYAFNNSAANGPYYFRFYFRYATLPTAQNTIFGVLATSSISAPNASITIDNTGVLRVKLLTTQQGTASSALIANTWYRVELNYDGAGALEAKLDGTSFGTASGLGSIGTAQAFDIGGNLNQETQTTGDFYFDDIAVNDTSGSVQNSWPGAGSVVHLLPNAAGDVNTFGTQTGGTAGAANNYTRVLEVTPDDATTLNGSSTLNQEDLFNIDTPFIGSDATVTLVHVAGRFRNSTSDTTAAIKFEIEKAASGTILQSAAIVPTSTTWRTNAVATSTTLTPPITAYTDPDGAAWTGSSLTNTQIGYKLTSGPAVAGRRVDVSKVYAIVEYVPVMEVESTSNSGAQTSVSSLSWTHQVKGSSRVLIVGISNWQSPEVHATAVTYNGTAMTLIRLDQNVAIDSSELWYLANPSTGANTLAITLSGTAGGAAAGALTISGADTSNPIDNNTGTTGTSSAPSNSITPVANNTLIIDHISWDDPAHVMTPTSPQLTGWNVPVTGQVLGVASYKGTIATAASTAMSWTSDFSIRYSQSIISIKPAGTSTTTTKTETGISRIQKSVTRTETGTARIQVTTPRTETGITRICISTPRTESGISRITISTPRTESGVTRITATTTRTELGTARIQKSVTQTESGISRISISTVKTESGIARIQKSVTQTESGISRITNTATKTETGVSRITVSTQRTETGISRISSAVPRTETGISAIRNTTLRTETGISSIRKTATQTESGISRIKIVSIQTETGVSRITVSVLRTESGITRITATTTKTATGTAAIRNTTTRSETGIASISKVALQTESGISRITISTARPETGISRIQKTSTQTETGVSRIQKSVIQTETGLSRIALVTLRTATGVSRLLKSVQRTLAGTARITATTTRTETGISAIRKTTTQTESGISRLTKSVQSTESGIARINVSTTKTETGVSKIVPAKAAVLQDNFNTNSLNTTKWNNTGGSNLVNTNSRIEITSTTAANYFDIRSQVTYDLTSSYVYAQLVNAGNQSLTTYESVLYARIDSNNQVYWSVSGNQIHVKQQLAGSYSTLTSTSYNSTTHQWFRIREASGTTYFDYSADGTSWTNFHSVTNIGAMDSVTLALQAGHYADEATTTTTIWDNFNTTVENITTGQTETGISRVTVATSQTETGISRIQKSLLRTESGISRIQKTVTQTETGISRVTISTSRTESGIARVTSSTSGTETGISRITVTTTKTENGAARIQKSVAQTELGTSRITTSTTKTENGVSRIYVSVTRTETGISRIQKVVAQTETGISRISQVSVSTETGTSRITASTGQTETGVAAIQKASTKTETGISRIQNTAGKTEAGVARIAQSETVTETGNSRITTSTTKIETGSARITATTVRVETGTSSIQTTTIKTETGISNIVEPSTKRTLTGTASILSTVSSFPRIIYIDGKPHLHIRGRHYIKI